MDSTYQSFTQLYIRNLTQLLHEYYTAAEVLLQRIQKVNEVKEALCIKYADSPVAPTVYLDDKYALYQYGQSVEQIARDTVEQLMKLREQTPEIPVMNAESAKENLYCVVINAEENAELLKQVPYEKIHDLAVIPRFRVGEESSFIVKNEHCTVFQLTGEEIMEIAHSNTNKQEFMCQNMGEMMRELMIKEGIPDEFADELLRAQGEQCPAWILTNESKFEGAVAIASEEVLKVAHDKLGEDFYVLPSSRHEVILVPMSVVADVEDLKSMVREVNANEVSKADKLSDSVYRFDGRRLSLADAVAKTVEAGKQKIPSRNR